MRGFFLRGLKWIMLLLVSLATARAFDSFFLGMHTYQASPWNYLLSLKPLLMECTLPAFVLVCFFLMLFRYMTSSVFQVCEACYPDGKEPDPGFSQNEDILQKIEPRHAFSLGLFLVPQFFFSFLGALSVRYVNACLFWLLFLPIFDGVAFVGLKGIGLRMGLLQARRRLREKERSLRKAHKIAINRDIELMKTSFLAANEMNSGTLVSGAPTQEEAQVAEAKAAYKKELESYQIISKPFVQGPEFIWWDLKDFCSILLFLPFCVVRYFTTNPGSDPTSSQWIDSLGASFSIAAILFVSAWNIFENWSSYYKRYLLFLLRA